MVNLLNIVGIPQNHGGVLVFYDNFVALCKKKGVSPSRAVTDMGMNRSIATFWKNGTAPKADTLSRIAEYFGVPAGVLLDGTEHTEKAPALTDKDQRDIARDLERIMDALENAGDLQFDGDPMSDEARESIRAAMKLGLEAAKVKNKERFTPKKYRKG